MCEITHKELKSLIKYKKTTGEIIRKRTGDVAGYTSKKGYVQVKLRGKTYLAHVIAWYYVTGEYPSFIVDHKDHVRWNNRWSNLRKADEAMNSWNTRRRSDNTSGVKGLCKDSRTGLWRARLGFRGRVYSCGYHKTKRAATEALRVRRNELHGEFACHG